MFARYLEEIPDRYMEDEEGILISNDQFAFVLVTSRNDWWRGKTNPKKHINIICLCLESYVSEEETF